MKFAVIAVLSIVVAFVPFFCYALRDDRKRMAARDRMLANDGNVAEIHLYVGDPTTLTARLEGEEKMVVIATQNEAVLLYIQFLERRKLSLTDVGFHYSTTYAANRVTA